MSIDVCSASHRTVCELNCRLREFRSWGLTSCWSHDSCVPQTHAVLLRLSPQ